MVVKPLAPEAANALLAEFRLAGHSRDTASQEMRNEGNQRKQITH